MPRTARVIVPGMPHHFTQRGNRGQQTFFSLEDQQYYLLSLAKYGQKYGLRVWAYCLMSNHMHLIAVPQTETAPAEVFRILHTLHSQKVNARHGLGGHLWQGRYYSSVLDGEHLHAAVRYVERNPVRAGIVEKAEDYMWSSARPHAGLRKDTVLSQDLPLLETIPDWAGWLRDEDDMGTVYRIREATMRGDPCGGLDFLANIGQVIGRDLTKRLRGRPRKIGTDTIFHNVP